VTDHLGSVTEVTDSAGKVVWKSEYTPYGEDAGIEASYEFAGMFAGQDIDRDTGLTYHWNRWRSEDGTRFISEDPAQDGINYYAYAGNSPLCATDPTGLTPAGYTPGPNSSLSSRDVPADSPSSSSSGTGSGQALAAPTAQPDYSKPPYYTGDYTAGSSSGSGTPATPASTPPSTPHGRPDNTGSGNTAASAGASSVAAVKITAATEATTTASASVSKVGVTGGPDNVAAAEKGNASTAGITADPVAQVKASADKLVANIGNAVATAANRIQRTADNNINGIKDLVTAGESEGVLEIINIYAEAAAVTAADNVLDTYDLYTKSNFRAGLKKITGVDPFLHDAHHMLPQALRERVKELYDGLNVDNPRYGAWWWRPDHLVKSYMYNVKVLELIERTKGDRHGLFAGLRQLAADYDLTWNGGGLNDY
jgi:RHS repeat-associated core domain